MSRLDDIEQRARALPFGAPFVAGQVVPPQWLTYDGLNELRSLATADIPYLLAEVRRLRDTVENFARGGPFEGANSEIEFAENALAAGES